MPVTVPKNSFADWLDRAVSVHDINHKRNHKRNVGGAAKLTSRGIEVKFTVLPDFCRSSSFWRVFFTWREKSALLHPLQTPHQEVVMYCNSAHIIRMEEAAFRRPVLFRSTLSCPRLIVVFTPGSIRSLKIDFGAGLSHFSNTWRTIPYLSFVFIPFLACPPSHRHQEDDCSRGEYPSRFSIPCWSCGWYSSSATFPIWIEKAK